MIQATAYLLITVILVGLIVLALFWVLESMFKLVVPVIVKQALGLIAIVVIILRLCQIWGIA